MEMWRKHLCSRHAALGVLVGLAGAMGLPDALAADHQGEWVGMDIVDGRPSAIRILIDGTGLLARFGAPRRCTVSARAADAADATSTYDVFDSNGYPYCDALYPGSVLLSDSATGITAQIAGVPVAMWRPGQVPAGHGDPQPLLGTWQRQAPPEDGSRGSAQLMLGGVVPGDRGNTLRYGGMRACKVTLVFEGDVDGGFEFSVSPGESGGGYCDRLLDRRVRLQPQGDGVELRFIPKTGECDAGCELVRSGG